MMTLDIGPDAGTRVTCILPIRKEIALVGAALQGGAAYQCLVGERGQRYKHSTLISPGRSDAAAGAPNRIGDR